MGQQKFITSHRARVQRANKLIAGLPKKVSIIDREAYIEFFLLEDIERLCQYSLKEAERELKSADEGKLRLTDVGRMALEANIEYFGSILYSLQAAIDVAREEIRKENYKFVWQAIPEGPLMRAASNLNKYGDTLREMIETLLDEITESARKATGNVDKIQEIKDKAKAHDANARAIHGISSREEVGQIVNPQQVVAPVDNNAIQGKINPNKPNLN